MQINLTNEVSQDDEVNPEVKLPHLARRLFTPATTLAPDTDLAPFEGPRVEVTQVEDGTRYAWRGVLTGLRHGPGGATCLMTVEQWASGVHAAEQSTTLRYGNATVRLI